jgi:tetratricopeptide (TPR) repeat protein
VSFLRRVFSADYRAAVAAEAAGNVDLAAERYALAGEHAGAVRMHLARAARAASRQAEVAALRDAVRWAGADPELQRQASKALGRALWQSAKAEGIATERDRTRVREAAALLVAGEDFHSAGAALESIGDHQAAAQAYSAGGLVDKLEHALAHDEASATRARDEADAFASYETHMRIGRRDDARADLARAVARADKGEYRRLLDELDIKLLTGGRLELHRRGKPTIVVCAADKIVVGRDPLCDLPLRTGGVSRHHAEITKQPDGYFLRDLESRNGTQLGGLPVAGHLPLVGHGRFSLGEDCALDFEQEGRTLIVRVASGLDRGLALIAGDDGAQLALSSLGLGLTVTIVRGRPHLGRGTCKDVMFDGEPLGELRVQLIRGDHVVADGEELDIG